MAPRRMLWGAVLRFLFSGKGRASRRDIWVGYALPYLIACVVAGAIDAALATRGGAGLASLAVRGAFLWPTYAVSAKRFHDLGMSGWWALRSTMMTIAPLIALPFAADAARNGWYVTAWAATGIGLYGFAVVWLIFFYLLYCKRGEYGANPYGSDPVGVRMRSLAKQRFTGPWAAAPVRRADPRS